MTVPVLLLLVTTAFQTPVTETGTTATPSRAAAVAVASTRVSPSETITGTAASAIHDCGAHQVGAEAVAVSPAAEAAGVAGVSHFAGRPSRMTGSSRWICGTPGDPSGCHRGHTRAPPLSPPRRAVTFRP